ncbi:general transcription factor IIH subunit 2-like [Sycon ciliatum]|uniref:general transcription factor IIH subunit 2-like n=1 Tax=Sycon ciliatum TaxID=27933 RepID=UPI0020AED4E7|eukprot:scpid44477/ scgid31726/ General transcription factor IIH subunit 2; Basic transcription factor 2 44 kDa subunit; General transcription factor IIH polypeptide 2; TFIIH basal transcription factor complex p44 subunit
MDEEEKAYVWEADYERSWEALHEDAEGSLQAAVDDIALRAQRRRAADRPANVRLGMMRHLFIVVDLSLAMREGDMWPTRLDITQKLLKDFLSEYFNQNPISQVGVIITKNGRAERITTLSGNSALHLQSLEGAANCAGEPSLQNALDMATGILKNMPGHSSREILVILGSLTSCDPGDIFQTIEDMKTANVQCSIIGLAASVFICKQICEQTRGTYTVALDETHFRDLLFRHVPPPPAESGMEASLIRMGFPQHHAGSIPSLCACHVETPNLTYQGYFCPQCKTKYCDLPVDCKACQLTLVSAPHLARSYHHLFPLPSFKELQVKDTPAVVCCGCQLQLQNTLAYMCPNCQNHLCSDCDVYVHDSLHSCPGCCSSAITPATVAGIG